jgi:hypothetical protein
MDLASGSFPECGDLSGPVQLAVGAGGQLEQGLARSFDQFEACLP